VRNIVPRRPTPLSLLKREQLTNNQRAAKSAAGTEFSDYLVN
jgi:hypothetical protein